MVFFFFAFGWGAGQSKNMGFSYLDVLSKLFSTLKL
jgi:hypothetical protein